MFLFIDSDDRLDIKWVDKTHAVAVFTNAEMGWYYFYMFTVNLWHFHVIATF